MTTKTEMKHAAQDDILQGIANVVLAYEEGSYEDPDGKRLEEVRKQGKRVMKMFGVTSFPGLGSV